MNSVCLSSPILALMICAAEFFPPILLVLFYYILCSSPRASPVDDRFPHHKPSRNHGQTPISFVVGYTQLSAIIMRSPVPNRLIGPDSYASVLPTTGRVAATPCLVVPESLGSCRSAAPECECRPLAPPTAACARAVGTARDRLKGSRTSLKEDSSSSNAVC